MKFVVPMVVLSAIMIANTNMSPLMLASLCIAGGLVALHFARKSV
jgi:hypothetical protein